MSNPWADKTWPTVYCTCLLCKRRRQWLRLLAMCAKATLKGQTMKEGWAAFEVIHDWLHTHTGCLEIEFSGSRYTVLIAQFHGEGELLGEALEEVAMQMRSQEL